MRTLQFSAHLGYLFAELPLEERAVAAAWFGFTAVEHPRPFAIPAPDMQRTLGRYGLTFVQLAGGTGDPAKGEKGLASLAGREADFRTDFDRALEYAATVGALFIHPMAGVVDAAERARAKDVYLENIRYAVERTAGTGVGVLIEAISEAAVPGYAVPTLAEASAVQEIFGPDRVSLLIDTFHAAVAGIDLPLWLRAHPQSIGHVHIADFPGRHEPGTGRTDFSAILNALEDTTFHGAIGFEYVPSRSTAQSLEFLPAWRSRFGKV